MQNIFLVGPMGAGKTTIGKILSQKLGFEFLDTDAVITARCGVEITTIFEIEGEAGFREREAKLIDELTQLPSIVLSTGGGAVLNAQSRHHLLARGLVIYLCIHPQEQFKRTKGDRGRPLIQGNDPLGRLTELFERRHPLYLEACDYICYPIGQNPQKIANEIGLLHQSLQEPLNSYTLPDWLHVK